MSLPLERVAIKGNVLAEGMLKFFQGCRGGGFSKKAPRAGFRFLIFNALFGVCDCPDFAPTISFILLIAMIRLIEKCGNIFFGVRLIPKSSRNKIIGEYNSALKLRLTAPPVEGEANQALVRFLAKSLGISRSQVELISGFKSKDKKISVSGLTLTELKTKIKALTNNEEDDT